MDSELNIDMDEAAKLFDENSIKDGLKSNTKSISTNRKNRSKSPTITKNKKNKKSEAKKKKKKVITDDENIEKDSSELDMDKSVNKDKNEEEKNIEEETKDETVEKKDNDKSSKNEKADNNDKKNNKKKKKSEAKAEEPKENQSANQTFLTFVSSLIIFQYFKYFCNIILYFILFKSSKRSFCSGVDSMRLENVFPIVCYCIQHCCQFCFYAKFVQLFPGCFDPGKCVTVILFLCLRMAENYDC